MNTALVTDGSLHLVTELRYRAAPPERSAGGNPWGGVRAAIGTPAAGNAFTYTGQRQEAALGLMFYQARWYDAQLGRFLSPDTYIPDPFNPVDYDRYTYTRNNPVNFNDPSGHASSVPNGPGCNDQSCQIVAAAIATFIFSPINVLQPTSVLPSVGPSWTAPGISPQPNVSVNGSYIGPDQGLARKLKILAELERLGLSTNLSLNMLEAIETVSNYGRPFYKQIKAGIPAGGLIEGIIGSGIQFLSDLGDPGINDDQYFLRAMVTGGEDWASDAVSSFLATITAPAGMLAGAAITGGTGPGSTVGGFIGGVTTFFGVSYGITRIIDQQFWPGFNRTVFPNYFH